MGVFCLGTTCGILNYLCHMKKEVSKFLSLNLFDIFKGIVMFFLAAVGEFSIQLFEYVFGHFDQFDIFRMCNIGVMATISYLIKQYFTGRKQEPEPFKPQKIK